MFGDKQNMILIIILLIEIFLTISIFSEEYVYQQWQKEEIYQINEFGETSVNRVKEQSSKVYDMLFVETGIAKSIIELFIPNRDQRDRTKGMEKLGATFFDYASNRMVLFWDSVYQAIYRLFIIIEYFPLILPLLIPGIIDGLMKREIKKRNYGYASSVRFTFSLQMTIMMLLLLPIYLFIPLAIAPKVILICGYLLVFFSIILTANIQKQI